ncbi:MAG: YkgJ family cysteine cluster protein [Planctomycetes bacterium]|nr:YkgJ family cysteine cluster protein [Planctomycetota bacterium]
MTFTPPILAEGRVRFAFGCNRCGNCCSNQSGFVWIEPDELEPMARRLQMTVEAFARRFVRRVDGRFSLIEQNGSCSLLRNKNECSVYDDRPRQCREFPFWPSILDGGESYNNARELCPGIHEVPPPARREAAYADLREFYKSADARIGALKPKCELSGNCCNFPEYGHKLYATLLETDFAAEYGPAIQAGSAKEVDLSPLSRAHLSQAERDDWCAFYHQKKCHAREARPLACRVFFCDTTTTDALLALHEVLLSELRALARRHDYPPGYGDFVELLPARRAALALLDKLK